MMKTRFFLANFLGRAYFFQKATTPTKKQDRFLFFINFFFSNSLHNKIRINSYRVNYKFIIH